MKHNDKIIIEKTEKNFVIDFFELAFLTEACLPKSTIARDIFFMDVIDTHYHEMNWEQRKHFFTWIGKKLNMEYEESQIFYARFNPDNQFNLTTVYQDKTENIEAFLLNDNYYIASSRKVNNDYIKRVEKIII
jgi:5-deoxy-D-glucuronate isomerase